MEEWGSGWDMDGSGRCDGEAGERACESTVSFLYIDACITGKPAECYSFCPVHKDGIAVLAFGWQGD